MTKMKWSNEWNQALVGIKSIFALSGFFFFLRLFSLYLFVQQTCIVLELSKNRYPVSPPSCRPSSAGALLQNYRIGSIWKVGLLMWFSESVLTLHMMYICTTPPFLKGMTDSYFSLLCCLTWLMTHFYVDSGVCKENRETGTEGIFVVGSKCMNFTWRVELFLQP